MARRPREEVEDGVFHVYARGNGKQLIYLDDHDRLTYLRLLGKAVERSRWRCLAYCQMENHVHLLIQTPHANLAAGMRWLHGLYAQAFNERHGRVGHLFQGRYGAVRIKTDAQLCAVARYLALNPIAAGLDRHPAEWRWSSYAATAAGSPPGWLDVRRLIAYFDTTGRQELRRYVEFVEDELAS
jgi:REP-associated tyrosine transposase